MSIIKRARWKDPSGKVTDYDLGANAANVSQDSTHRFVSDTEKNNWNTKLGSTGDGSNLTSKFSQASSRTNLSSGEKDSVSKGKIMKFFADLKAVAFSGSYNDLANKPSIPSGAAASQAVANNCTTTAAGSVLDARQGKVLMDKANQLSSDLEWKLYQEVEKGDPCNLSTLTFRELLLILKIGANIRRATICIPKHYFDRMAVTGDTYTFETGSANRLYGVKITNSSITFTSCLSEGNVETDAAMDIYYR